jgi:hypothetical protein
MGWDASFILIFFTGLAAPVLVWTGVRALP